MANFNTVCLVHYHEVGLKGKNRSHFEHILIKNLYYSLRDVVKRENGLYISRISGHELVEFPSDVDPDMVVSRLCQVPGVAKVSLANACSLDFESISNAAISVLKAALPATTFKVHAKRANSHFDMHTLDIMREVGAILCKTFPDLNVDVHTPEVTVHVLINQEAAYVWAKSENGIGGLPVGTAGKCISLFSSGFDSPVATWKLGRRGATMIPVHFSGRPEVSDESEVLCQELVAALAPEGSIGRLYVIPFGEIQKEIALAVPEDLRIIMYRRLMFLVSEKIAQIEGAKALITGESLGQVASQTLENMYATSEVLSCLPVLRPLVGSDKQEIIDRARELGTYDISSESAPDACTLFMPKRPETHASIKRVRAVWASLPVDEFVERALTALEYVDTKDCAQYKPPKELYRVHTELRPAYV